MDILHIIIIIFIFTIPFLYRLVRTGSFSFYIKRQKYNLDENYKKAEIVRIFQVLFLLLFLLFHGYIFWGILNLAIFIIITFLVSMLMEIIGEKSGITFGGKYKYNLNLTPGPSLFSIPILIPLAWIILIYMSYNLFCFIGNFNVIEIIMERNIKLLIVPCIMLVLLDFILDPIAVDEKRWEWNIKGNYYGVPLLNFFGWFINSLIILLLLSYFFLPFEIQAINVENIKYLPGVIFIFIHLAASRPCFERDLNFAGYFAIILTLAYVVLLTIK